MSEKITWWARKLGCWQVDRVCKMNEYRCSWGSFMFSRGFGLGYSVYHDSANIFIYAIFLKVFIKVPMIINQRPGTEDYCASYGFQFGETGWHFNWRDKCKILWYPWSWDHIRHTYLWPDGRSHHDSGKREYQAPEETKTSYPYTYVLKSGEVQFRTAVCNGEEREWRWRCLKWLPYPRRVERTVNVDFSGEVGEQSGSWKGGTIGCSTDWKPGETLQDALRRMEAERVFK